MLVLTTRVLPGQGADEQEKKDRQDSSEDDSPDWPRADIARAIALDLGRA